VLGRSSEVRKTTLGQSLAELGGRRVTRYLWKELERLGESAAINGRADRVLERSMGGYTALWALTVSDLVVLTEQDGASRVIPLAQIRGVVRPADGTIRVLLGGTELVAIRSSDADVEPLARAIADRAHAPVAGADALFSADGFVQLAGTPVRLTGEYLGGFRDLAAGNLTVVFDETGAHLVPAATPWWRACALPWPDVREILVEGQEETRRRVTATRIMTVGLLALAIPKDENHSRAYVTVAAKDGGVVVRVDGARHQELKARLADVLRRPAGAEGAGPDAGGQVDLAGQVARLGELHRAGVLTDEEFGAAKRKLLDL
jgi:Short C-terminal domain